MKRERHQSLPEIEIEATIRAGIFKNKSEAIETALSTFFSVKPKMKIEAAIQLYKEEKVTIGRAAEIAGMDRWEFKDIIEDRGIRIVIECDSKEEIDNRLDILKKL